MLHGCSWCTKLKKLYVWEMRKWFLIFLDTLSLVWFEYIQKYQLMYSSWHHYAVSYHWPLWPVCVCLYFCVNTKIIWYRWHKPIKRGSSNSSSNSSRINSGNTLFISVTYSCIFQHKGDMLRANCRLLFTNSFFEMIFSCSFDVKPVLTNSYISFSITMVSH